MLTKSWIFRKRPFESQSRIAVSWTVLARGSPIDPEPLWIEPWLRVLLKPR